MTVKIAISVPDEIFSQVAEAAAEQGRSRSAVFVEAMEKYLFYLETKRLEAAWAAIPAEDFELDPEEKEWLEWRFQEHVKRLDAEEAGADRAAS